MGRRGLFSFVLSQLVVVLLVVVVVVVVAICLHGQSISAETENSLKHTIKDRIQRFVSETEASVVSINKFSSTAGFVRFSQHKPFTLPATTRSKFASLLDNSNSNNNNNRYAAEVVLKQLASYFFAQHGSIFGITDASKQLQFSTRNLADRVIDNLQHVDLQQVHKGVPVFGGNLKIHFDSARDFAIYAVNGMFLSDIRANLDTEPTLSSAEAISAAIRAVVHKYWDKSRANEISAQEFSESLRSEHEPKLHVIRKNILSPELEEDDALVYEVFIISAESSPLPIRETVFIDAHTGEFIYQWSRANHGQIRRNIYKFPVSAAPFWTEGKAFPTSDPDANVLIQTANDTYNFYKVNFNYESWDGKNGVLTSIFNIIGSYCPNAWWDGEKTNFCQGFACEDVVAHEWTHAYTETTHGLIYSYQSGALNEAYSDIFGETIQMLFAPNANDAHRGKSSCYSPSSSGSKASHRWLIGVNCSGTGGPIRDMYYPSCYLQPPKTNSSLYFCSSTDGGGVHTNSGVPNHAYALLVDGGFYNNIAVQPIGITKAINIYWRAASVYQTPTTQFRDHADALEQSCLDFVSAQTPLRDATTLDSSTTNFVTMTMEDCAQLANAIAAVELRKDPPCQFSLLLKRNAPPLCSFEEIDNSTLGNATLYTNSVFFDEFSRNPATSSRDYMPSVEKNATVWSFSNMGVFAEWKPMNWAWVNVRDISVPYSSLSLSGLSGYALWAVNNKTNDGCVIGTDDQSGVRMVESPLIRLPGDDEVDFKMAFDHLVRTEKYYDAGNLKISVNGAPYEFVANSSFLFNGYTSNILPTSPDAGQQGFSGTDPITIPVAYGGWARSILDLSPYASAGDTIRIRFDFSQDGCNGEWGWLIKNIHIYSCGTTQEPELPQPSIDQESSDTSSSSEQPSPWREQSLPSDFFRTSVSSSKNTGALDDQSSDATGSGSGSGGAIPVDQKKNRSDAGVIAAVVIVVLIVVILVIAISVLIAILVVMRRMRKASKKVRSKRPPVKKEGKRERAGAVHSTMPEPTMELKTFFTETITSKFAISSRHISNSHKIAQGAYGSVYKAEYNGDPVACRVLQFVKDSMTNHEEDFKNYIAEFEREISTLILLRHPNIIGFHGIIFRRHELYIVTEFMEDGSLDQWLLKKRNSQDTSSSSSSSGETPRRLTWPQKLKILHDCAKGLKSIHARKIIHRDIKSNNILLTSSSARANQLATHRFVAKLADFGLGKPKRPGDRSHVHMKYPSLPYWTAPEVIKGAAPHTEASDVYAFGIVINEVIFEKVPYSHITGPTAAATIPQRVAEDPTFRPLAEPLPLAPPGMVADKNSALFYADEKSCKMLVHLMQLCWDHDPEKRPVASDVEKAMARVCNAAEEAAKAAPKVESLADKFDF